MNVAPLDGRDMLAADLARSVRLFVAMGDFLNVAGYDLVTVTHSGGRYAMAITAADFSRARAALTAFDDQLTGG